jgi:hypothetical protein
LEEFVLDECYFNCREIFGLLLVSLLLEVLDRLAPDRKILKKLLGSDELHCIAFDTNKDILEYL